MNRLNRPATVLLLGNVILVTMVAQANHYLAPWQLHLWLGGLLVTPAALTARHRAGAIAVFLTGLAMDATSPVAFGTQALVLLAGHALVYTWRDRLARGEATAQTLAALMANLVTFLLLAVAESFAAARPGGVLGRLLADLVASQLVLMLVAPWFCALQSRLFAPARGRGSD
jgi:rod shape-determining protein MreD